MPAQPIVSTALLLSAIVLTPAVATATTITFEEYPPFTLITTQYAAQGVALFSSPDGDPRIFDASTFVAPISGNGLLGFQGTVLQSVRADFVTPALNVSIDGGDLSFDVDDMFLYAFSASNVLLASSNLLLNGSGTVTLTVSSATPIAYVEFFSNSAINGSSIVWDNLTFDSVNGELVPEPGTLLLLGAGLGAVAARRRLKKRA